MIARHLLSALPDALPLKTGLLVHLAYFHEDHGRREQVQLLVQEQARHVLQEQSLVIRAVEQANGLATHVTLLHNKLFQVELECEVAVVFTVDGEHGLHEDDTITVVDVEVYILLSGLHELLLLVDLLRTRHVDAHIDRALVRAAVIELEVDLDVFLALFLLVCRRYRLRHLARCLELLHVIVSVGRFSSARTLLSRLELLAEDQI